MSRRRLLGAAILPLSRSVSSRPPSAKQQHSFHQRQLEQQQQQQQQRLSIATAATRMTSEQQQPPQKPSNPIDKAELKKRLTPFQWHITQEKGTERPFTGCYNKHYEQGVYTCVVCEQELFSSENKYDSGCGWPAFNEVLDQGKVILKKDTTLNMVRTEVLCSSCNAHLGHIFNDGPKPTRKRFCINSASLNFHPPGEKKE